jgi:hypothetical protein
MNTTYIKNDRLGRITLEYMAQAKNIFVDAWEKSVDFFTSYHWREIVFNMKLISILVSLLFGGLIFFLMFKMNSRGRMQRAAATGKDFAVKMNNKKIVKKWGKIENKLVSESGENHKLAILEADNLFEEVLKTLGSASEIRITDIGEIQEAKKTKNSIIDNSEFELNREEATKIIKTYKKGLMELGVI